MERLPSQRRDISDGQEVDGELKLYVKEESRDISNRLVTLGGHYLPPNHFNLCPFMQQLPHITVLLWVHCAGGSGVFSVVVVTQ